MATNSKEVQRKADEKRRGSRARYWTVIVYPESAPADWRDVIDKEHIQWIESPLHDKDTNPDGEVKKAHWHLLLLYSGMKSYSQVKKLADNLNAPSPEVCSEARGLVRYMAHLDNPEKHQYPVNDIKGHGGADVGFYLEPTSGERLKIIDEMCSWVSETGCIYYSDLLNYAKDNRRYDWYPALINSCTYVMKEYIYSEYRKAKFYFNGK